MTRKEMIVFLEKDDIYHDLDYNTLTDEQLTEWCIYHEKINLGMTAVDFFSEDPTECIDDINDGYLGSFFAYPGEIYDDVIRREAKEMYKND